MAVSTRAQRKKRQSRRRTSSTRRPPGFPILKKVDETGMRYKYKLDKTARSRRLALTERVDKDIKKSGRSTRRAAIAKKGRLNVLRIYRRYRNVPECKKITSDMRYMDRKYNLGKTRKICGK
jgi:hypothetical protein